jgi:hypothetical protein
MYCMYVRTSRSKLRDGYEGDAHESVKTVSDSGEQHMARSDRASAAEKRAVGTYSRAVNHSFNVHNLQKDFVVPVSIPYMLSQASHSWDLR